MLHVMRHSMYRQEVYTPATAPAGTAWLACIGRLRGSGSFDLEQRSPGQVALHVVQSGAGWLATSGGPAQPLAPGDLFAVLPGEPARYREDPRRPWRYTWLGLAGASSLDLTRAMGFTGTVRILTAVATPALWRLCDQAQAAYAAAVCSPFTPAALAMRLGEALVPAGSPRESADPAAALRLVIDSGYDGDLTIAGAANRLAVDRSTLYRRFRANYGSGPRAYLRQVRLDRARDLLRRGHGTVTAIAAACGYADHRAFARAYRARFAVVPSQDLAR